MTQWRSLGQTAWSLQSWGNQGCMLNNRTGTQAMQTSPRLRAEESSGTRLPMRSSKSVSPGPCTVVTTGQLSFQFPSSFRAQKFIFKPCCPHQPPHICLAQLFRVWFSGCDIYKCGCSQLWKSGPKCTSIAQETGVKGVVSYWAVLARENELHHQPMQSPSFWGRATSQISLKLPQKIREASPRRASQEVYSTWTSRLLTRHFVLLLRAI